MGMSYYVFCDESGISKGPACYTIAGFAIREDRLEAFNTYFHRRVERRGVEGEVKWQKVKKGANIMNVALDLTKATLKSRSGKFATIAVKKATFHKWRSDPESAFYMTYNYLLRDVLKLTREDCIVVMDEKSDAYGKQDEVVHRITNNMAAQVGRNGRVLSVSKNDSKLHPGIQFADILAGAVNAACDRHLRGPAAETHPGKELLMDRMAAVLGLPDLACDTWPSNSPNLWHFPHSPPGWRSSPSSENIVPNYRVRSISREELDAALAKAGR